MLFFLLSSSNSCGFRCQRWCDMRFIHNLFHIDTIWGQTKAPVCRLQQLLIWWRREPDGERKKHEEEENPANRLDGTKDKTNHMLQYYNRSCCFSWRWIISSSCKGNETILVLVIRSKLLNQAMAASKQSQWSNKSSSRAQNQLTNVQHPSILKWLHSWSVQEPQRCWDSQIKLMYLLLLLVFLSMRCSRFLLKILCLLLRELRRCSGID